ncbi:amidase [Glaciihabitans sp. dw_435]|uniref:amidase n=1 Tax=Glaciihabitans sp. dw_435 TaxID=2720081 RepID=UPI001BD2EF0D|nr:amidase [Glaciihabitans sp. dw_435]
MSAADEQVRQTITPQLDLALAASRRRPLPASPSSAADEPADADLLFRALLADAPAAAHDSAPAATTTSIANPAIASVTELLAAFAAGLLTPSALIATLRPRWSAAGPAPAAVLASIPGIDAAAAESDRRWAAGTPRPLEGVPFAVKDIIDVGGAMVTSGSWQTGDRIAPVDATVVDRLRQAGAIPVFMSATTEFACGAPVNGRYGAVPNPWNEEMWTGGSSTGSASALAAGLVPFALGSDTGGSIRVPSALCGLTGIKPTYGLVPRTGVSSLSWTMDHIGPMARSAADLALLLPVMAGPDGVDATAGATVPDLAPDPASVAGLRIGVPRGWFTERCDAEVLAALESAIASFTALGAQIVPIEFDDLDAIHDESWNVFYGELASNQEANADRRDLFDDGTNARLDCGFVPLAVDYLRALRRRPVVQRDMLERMDASGVDLLLTPAVGATAPSLATLTMDVDGVSYNLHDVIPRNMRIFDYTGFPALVAPAGLSSDGMPIGIQLVARPWQDRLCLAAAMAFQSATDHHHALPPVTSAWSDSDR